MAAYTQEQYDTLKNAIAEGALRVEYADKRIEYRSLDQMERLLATMATELGLTPAKQKGYRRVGTFSKGV